MEAGPGTTSFKTPRFDLTPPVRSCPTQIFPPAQAHKLAENADDLGYLCEEVEHIALGPD